MLKSLGFIFGVATILSASPITFTGSGHGAGTDGGLLIFLNSAHASEWLRDDIARINEY